MEHTMKPSRSILEESFRYVRMKASSLSLPVGQTAPIHRSHPAPPAIASRHAVHLLLAFANFAVGMGAFIVVSVLSPVASAFGVGTAEAGWLLTIFALVYAVTSPVLVATTGGVDRARVLLTGLILLTIGSVAGALAPSFGVLLASRALMAVGAGLVTPVAAAIGVASVDPEHRGRTLALIYGGLTLAQAVGVPAGAWLGYAVGWRLAFGIVAALAFLSAIVLNRFLPRGLAVQRTSLATLGAVLATPRLVFAIAFTALFVAGTFVVYTYLAPFLEARYGLSRNGVTAMMVVFGLGAVVGNAMGGFLSDRIGSVRTLVALCVAQLAIMPFLTLAHMSLLATGVAIGVWSVFGWSFQVPQQARLAALEPAKAPVLFALHAAAIYVGACVGSLIGGQTLEIGGYDALGPSGAAFIIIALGSLGIVARMFQRARGESKVSARVAPRCDGACPN
jgi:DHA1 family inner membrane transport protein